MDTAQVFAQVVSTLNLEFVLLISLGTLVGLIVGALPGLTTTMGIALLTGITFNFKGEAATALLVGLYVGGVSGGALSAILVGIPGTPASAATALDGFPLALQGRARQAIMVGRTASIIGTIFGIICLAFLTPMLQRLTIQFTSVEYFVLGLFGVLISGTMSGSDHPIKGWLAGILGVAVGLIGLDELCGYQRFTFGSSELLGGLPFIPIMIGFFGIPQVVETLQSEKDVLVSILDKTKTKFTHVINNIWNTIRSGLIGVGVGIIPGVGEDVASWVSYGVSKRASQKPEEFGKGSYEGLIASETANNACIGGAMIPLLSLGIPGSPPAAVLLGALMLHGIRPGPMLSFEFPAFLPQVVVWLVIATIAMWLLSMLIARPLARILQIKSAIIMPMVAVLCAIGSYALDLRYLNLILVFIAGLIGIVFRKGKYPAAPLVLGIILGPLVDSSFRRALQANDGNMGVFFARPVSLVLVFATLLLITTQVGIWKPLIRLFRRPGQNPPIA